MRISGRLTADRPTSWQVALPWARPPLALAVPLHAHARSSLRRRIHRDVVTMAGHALVPKGLHRIRVELHWETVPVPESPEMVETLKAVVDALVGYGLVPRDDSRHVSSDCEWHQGARNICWLVVTDLHPAR